MYDTPYLTLGDLTQAIDIGRSSKARFLHAYTDAHQLEDDDDVRDARTTGRTSELT